MRFPFEATPEELKDNIGTFVDAVFSCLESEFLVMPKGDGFIEYPVFEEGYESLKRSTGGFSAFSNETVSQVVFEKPVALIVLRTMLGFTPSEMAYVATRHAGVEVTQGAARSIDRNIRLAPTKPLTVKGVTGERVRALVGAACEMLSKNVPVVSADKLHRLDKADTRNGIDGLRSLSVIGVPYAMMLYERFLGRPFAGHRDSVSDIVGDHLEGAIEDVLAKAGVSYRKTRRAERIEGFDQTPDFIIPSEFNPQVVIEAKLTEDDGTARDKVTRVQHLAEIAQIGQPQGQPKFEVIALIAGRGFGERRKDMEKLILATRGKVFTLQNLDRLVSTTRLREFSLKNLID